MNQKITIQRFAAAIAEKADVSPELALEYTRELFGVITRELHKGEPVSIKEIGTFELSHIPGKPIVYTPAQKVAEEVNAPFLMFESEELADEVTDEMLNEIVVPSSEGVDDESATNVVTEIEVSEERAEVPAIEIQEESIEEVAEKADGITENQSASNVENVVSIELQKSETIVTNEDEIIEAEPSDNSDMQQEEQEVPPTYIPPIPTADYLPEDEEEFVATTPESKSSKLLFGIIVGLVIGLAVAALALVAYTAFVD